MDKLKLLDKIKQIYDNGENIMEYLKKASDNSSINSVEDIMISYDFQAGSYYNNYKNNLYDYEKYHTCIADVIKSYIDYSKPCVLMEAGIGEATTLGPVLNQLNTDTLRQVYGFDISWSRIKYAEKFLNETVDFSKIQLFVGDMFNIPVKDNSIDILYTVHAIEPNGGKEKEILEELYRATAKYLILFEPAYELADETAQVRMKQHGYVTELYKTALDLGYEILEYRLLETCLNPQNPTGVMVIRKSGHSDIKVPDNALCDPISGEELCINEHEAYCKSSMLMYPVILNIPCLLKSNAIIGTKYDNFKN